MRITFRMLSQGSLRNVSSSLERLTELQIKAGSLKKFQTPSDDPLAVVKTMGFETLLKHNEMYKTNVANAGMYIKMVDSTIISVKELMDSVKLTALEQRSDTATAETRAASAIEVKGILSEIKGLLNVKFHGKYIFSGHRIQTEPFQEVDGVVRYMGDEGLIRFRIGATRMIDVSVPGSRFLSLGESHRSDTIAMHPLLQNGTLLEDLNGGDGVSLGRIRITNGAGVSSDIDLTSCLTVGDVLNRINNAVPPLNIIAGTDPASPSLRIMYLGAGELTVSELDGGTTAFDLGILGTSSGGLLSGGELNPLLSEDTSLLSVDSLSGVLLEGIRVTIGDNSYIVDFLNPNYPSTIGELLGRITDTVPGLNAEINPTGDGIVLSSEIPFVIEEFGGGATAADLGILGNSMAFGPYSLFGALERLEQLLLQNDSNALDGVIAEIEEVIGFILEIEAEIGARGEQVEIIENQLSDAQTHLTENLSIVSDIDISEVLTQLSEAQLAYEAALKVTTSIYDLSLLKYYG